MNIFLSLLCSDCITYFIFVAYLHVKFRECCHITTVPAGPFQLLSSATLNFLCIAHAVHMTAAEESKWNGPTGALVMCEFYWVAQCVGISENVRFVQPWVNAHLPVSPEEMNTVHFSPLSFDRSPRALLSTPPLRHQPSFDKQSGVDTQNFITDGCILRLPLEWFYLSQFYM